MALLETYINNLCTCEPTHPSRYPKGQVFASGALAPQLSKTQTNRILVYRGSFNPPHHGHLKLLKHAFCHGAHDWNLIAAIIHPVSDIEGKCDTKGGKLGFSKDARAFLWKQDPGFPDWAWVFENGSMSIKDFLPQLKAQINSDGYKFHLSCSAAPTTHCLKGHQEAHMVLKRL